MGQWQALAVPTVRRAALRFALEAQGVAWNEAAHVTATTTLAQAIRDGGHVALPIATLIDAIVLPGLRNTDLRVEDLPTPGDLSTAKTYRDKTSDWQDQASGLRIQQYLRLEDRLRVFCRLHASAKQYRVLTRARREFTRTVVTLTAAGVHPAELRPTDPIADLAVRAWADIEAHVPGLSGTRDDLWMDPGRFRAQTEPDARNLADRIDRALRHLFPVSPSGRIQIVHHGFYFFTPPQWALFQLLREHTFVDQTFIVHDNQDSEVFETWRRFFTTSWDMPRPIPVAMDVEPPTAPARAFAAALRGDPVRPDAVGTALRVLECASPTELVRELRRESIQESGSPQRKLYAAQAADVERFLRRLGPEGVGGAVDLAQLPVGIFLLSLHRCIEPNQSALPTIKLAADDLMDMVATGFLDGGSGVDPPALVSALRRALPFFKGCTIAETWVERAGLLRTLIGKEVAKHGPRSETETDLERWQSVTGNPLRLVPWADLSVNEANWVEATVLSVADLARQVASRERVSLRQHVRFLTDHLERGMREVPEEDQQRIREKLRGLGSGPDLELDADGLVDVVTMLLGRRVDLDDEATPDATKVPELRALDALGFARISSNVHLANLSASTFPGRGPTVGWPLRIDDLRESATLAPVTLEILEARAQLGSLGDLYLLWLALDGIEPTNTVTLSWMAKVGAEPQNPSPLVTLLTIPESDSADVRERAGGISLTTAAPGSDLPPLTTRPTPAVAHSDIAELALAVAGIDPQAAASSLACPRRFALQWALGPTAAFQAEHHQTMLYGNLRNALVKLELVVNAVAASALANKLWPFLTPGQRNSSLDRSGIKPGKPSADPRWMLTLGGTKTGSSPVDKAYQAAMDDTPARASMIAPSAGSYLPAGVADPQICRTCPVRDHCSEAAHDS
jgi:hypothetical protein